MVDIDPSVRPQGPGLGGSVARGEAGALVVPGKRPHEDPLVAPALSRIGDEGPVRDLPAESVGDQAALLARGEADCQDEDGRKQEDKKQHDNDSENGNCK